MECNVQLDPVSCLLTLSDGCGLEGEERRWGGMEEEGKGLRRRGREEGGRVGEYNHTQNTTIALQLQ